MNHLIISMSAILLLETLRFHIILRGFQYPATGSAYVGLVTFTESGSNIREIITCELLSPLAAGQKYTASMKVSWSGAIANLASNNIGFYFQPSFILQALPIP
ncbi:MAG: hypothetical protein M3Q95_08700 [Bacteroidota bacterium]|nr:hypothetical protein [Bacteroidota bacterium]